MLLVVLSVHYFAWSLSDYYILISLNLKMCLPRACPQFHHRISDLIRYVCSAKFD